MAVTLQVSVRTIRILLPLCLLSAGIVACSVESDKRMNIPQEGVQGTRSYKLDPEAAAVQLTIFGMQMGTPDLQKFRFLMRALKNAGEFSSLIEKYSDTDGGLSMCAVFSKTASQDEIYRLIRSIETDAKSTELQAASTGSCTN